MRAPIRAGYGYNKWGWRNFLVFLKIAISKEEFSCWFVFPIVRKKSKTIAGYRKCVPMTIR
jgi:hypothetical protein